MLANEQQILDKLNDLHTVVTVVTVDIDYIKKAVDVQKTESDKQQVQIDGLNKWRAYLTGAWAVVVASMVWLISHIRGVI